MQTCDSITGCLIEESYEDVEVIKDKNDASDAVKSHGTIKIYINELKNMINQYDNSDINEKVRIDKESIVNRGQINMEESKEKNQREISKTKIADEARIENVYGCGKSYGNIDEIKGAILLEITNVAYRMEENAENSLTNAIEQFINRRVCDKH